MNSYVLPSLNPRRPARYTPSYSLVFLTVLPNFLAAIVQSHHFVKWSKKGKTPENCQKISATERKAAPKKPRGVQFREITRSWDSRPENQVSDVQSVLTAIVIRTSLRRQRLSIGHRVRAWSARSSSISNAAAFHFCGRRLGQHHNPFSNTDGYESCKERKPTSALTWPTAKFWSRDSQNADSVQLVKCECLSSLFRVRQKWVLSVSQNNPKFSLNMPSYRGHPLRKDSREAYELLLERSERTGHRLWRINWQQF